MTKEKIYSFNISPSGLELMGKCPSQWAHYNIYKTEHKEVESKPLQVGSAMHKLVENFYRGHRVIQYDKEWLIQNWTKYYNYRVNKEFRNKKDLDAGLLSLENLYRIMERYKWLTEPLSLNGKPAIELYFKTPYLGHDKYEVNISGKIDLVTRSFGDICLIDWKTGQSKKYIPDSLEDCFQIVLYAVALKKLYDINIYEQKLFLVYFYIDTVLEYRIEPANLDKIKSKINDFLDIYDSGEYQKIRGPHCKFCAFRDPCFSEEEPPKSEGTPTILPEDVLISDDIPF